MCTNGEIEILVLEKIETEESQHIKEENPVIIEDRPKKKSRRHESSEIKLLKDDLRVVVFHPDQQLMVRGECIELKFMCALSSVHVTGQAGIEGEFPINI